MARVTTVWRVDGQKLPAKLMPSSIEAETLLEDWIERSPSLLEPGLTVLARQLETGSGPLDLLCIDGAGRLVVVELKRAQA